jgi:DNA-binding NtrC family response regulator
LIVDDELDIVESIKIWLQKRGFVVHGFTNPLLALEYFKNNCNSIDIVLSDIRMPQMVDMSFTRESVSCKMETRL